MNLTQQDLRELATQLPPLEFVPERDCVWPLTAKAQAYLNDYNINFSEKHLSLEHGFGYVKAAGFNIATHYWLPENAIGTLVVVHGYYDHVGVFSHPIQFALQHNLAVLAFDLPGHGLSSGEPAAIDSFDQYGDVLAEILQLSAKMLPTPLYALGQSTGSAVLMNYLWRYGVTQNIQFSKIAFCSPLVLPRGWRGIHMGRFVYAIAKHFLHQIGRSFSQSSHDMAFNQFLKEEDPLQARTLPLSWVGAMKAWHETLKELPSLAIDGLIIQGTDDKTVEWEYNMPLLQRKLPGVNIRYIEGAGHQLVNESPLYRDQVFQAIENYFFNRAE